MMLESECHLVTDDATVPDRIRKYTVTGVKILSNYTSKGPGCALLI